MQQLSLEFLFKVQSHRELRNTKDTPQKEEVHTPDSTLTTYSIGRDTPDRSNKGRETPTTKQGKPTVYETRQHVGLRQGKQASRRKEGQSRP